MGNNPCFQLLSPWERLGEGVWPKAKHKETPAPIYRKQQRKGFRGQRLHSALIQEGGQG